MTADENGATGNDDNGDTAGGNSAEQPAAAAGGDTRFRIQKLYLKDVSFESPAAPDIFSADQRTEPRINLQLNTESRRVADNMYEVVLVATVTATAGEDEPTAFLVEVKQAGLFEVSGFPEDERMRLVGSYCPGVLFPFIREVVSDMVQKGGFPPLVLQPINFDALYAQQLAKQRQGVDAPETAQ